MTNKQKYAPPASKIRPIKLWQDNSHRSETRIEIIPLIDVIFCILTFFILAAVGLSRQQAITMDLPQASTGKVQMREMLVVSLDEIGRYYLEKELVSKNKLYEEVKRYHKLNPQGLMVLHASKNVTYKEVVSLLDMLREVGGDRVALATLPGESSDRTNINSDPAPKYLYNLENFDFVQPQTNSEE